MNRQRILEIARESFLDGMTGAGLFGGLRRPGAPTEFIDSREPVAVAAMPCTVDLQPVMAELMIFEANRADYILVKARGVSRPPSFVEFFGPDLVGSSSKDQLEKDAVQYLKETESSALKKAIEALTRPLPTRGLDLTETKALERASDKRRHS